MSKNFDVISGTLITTPEKAAYEKDPQSVVSSTKPAQGLHGEGVIVATFDIARFLKPGQTELPVGIYDLEEEFPDNAYVSSVGTLDVTKAKAGAGTLSVAVAGGTPVNAGSAGKAALTAQEFAVGTKNGGKKLQAVVTVGTVTAGTFIVRVPYVISGV